MEARKADGKRAYDFLKKFDYIRAAGSKEEKLAAEQIAEELTKLGLNPEIRTFTFTGREMEEAGLIVKEPFERELLAGCYLYSADTGENKVTGRFFFAEEGDDISLSLAKDSIALVSHRLSSKEAQRFEEAGVKAFVSVFGTPVDEKEDHVTRNARLRADRKWKIPGLQIHYQDARRLVEEGAETVTVYLKQREVTMESRNVTVRIEGKTKPEEIVALTAHYDSVPEGKGAYDNMAGSAILMEACRYFADHTPERTMEVTFFGAEEQGLQGSVGFLKEAEEEKKRYVANLNVDLAGQTVGGTVLGVTADEDMVRFLDKLLWREKIGARIKQQIWSGDANSFAFYGIPAVTLDRDGFGMHTRHDTIDLISAWALERDAELFLAIAIALDTAGEEFPAKPVPEAMREELNTYFSALGFCGFLS